MDESSELFIGLDVSKDSHAVAVAESGRNGEVRSFGEIGSDAASVRRLVRKLERRDMRLRFCYEAGPTGYLNRQCPEKAEGLARHWRCKFEKGRATRPSGHRSR